MISNVKGKTEISPDLPDSSPSGGFQLQFAVTLDLFFFISLGPRYQIDPATRHPFAVSRSDRISSTPYPR